MLRKAAEQLLKFASAGESWAVKELRDTLDGRPAQQVQLAGHDGERLSLTFESTDAKA